MFIYSTLVLIRHLWQLKRAVFLDWCLTVHGTGHRFVHFCSGPVQKSILICVFKKMKGREIESKKMERKSNIENFFEKKKT